MYDKFEYKREKVLLVEGPDDQSFFLGALDRLKLISTIDVVAYGGKDNLTRFLKGTATSEEFQLGVKSLAITRDADVMGMDRSTQSILGSLYLAGLTESQNSLDPAKRFSHLTCSAHIIRDSSGYGNLESMILECFEDDWRSDCVDVFWNCLGEKGDSLPKDEQKTRLAAFLAAQDEVARQYNEAVKRGQIDIQHPVFDELRAFLLDL